MPKTKVLKRMAEAVNMDFVQLLLEAETEVGGPIPWLPNSLAEIFDSLPKLTEGHRYILLGAARQMAAGQFVFQDWINV